MALGASQRDVIRESLRDTAQVFVLGLVSGTVAAVAGVRLAGSLIVALLFGLTPTDWTHVAIAAASMVMVGLVACLFLPSERRGSIRWWRSATNSGKGLRRSTRSPVCS
jgi:ABC-type antimicrobial peptide transport system permease subunit